MLNHLLLENIAVFERLALPVAHGLTMIVGEAGSGKSLLLDGLDWALGASVAAKEIIRAGADQGMVEVIFELPYLSDVLKDWLTEQGIDRSDSQTATGGFELVLSRTFSPNGTSRCRANGVLVPRTALEAIRGELVALQSQHAAVTLFQPAQQRAWLDKFGGEALEQARDRVKDQYHHWQALCQQLHQLEADQQAQQAEWDRLTQMDQELADAALKSPDEDDTLRQELDRLTHGEQLVGHYGDALSMLKGGGGGGGSWNSRGGGGAGNLADTLDKVRKRLTQAAAKDPAALAVADTAAALVEEIRDLAHQVSALKDGIDLRPHQLQALVERLDVLERVKRRYGPTLADVLAKQIDVANALIAMDSSPQRLEAIRRDTAQAKATLASAMAELSGLRRQAATAFEAGVGPLLAQLELPNARLVVELSDQPWSPQGADGVALLFSANPGEPPRAMGKVASGGELSRILLALKVLEAQRHQATGKAHQLLIFDEIDTGTSGQVARAIAGQLTTLAEAGHQVLVITHQPIVAAAGQQLWKVEKVIKPGVASSKSASDWQEQGKRAASQVHVATEHGERRALVGWLAGGISAATDEYAALGDFAELLLAQAGGRAK
jgi:DNA repair protein RecN (Recombination protein N)